MIKYYCDVCGKETFHLDLYSYEDKQICPDCMKVRSWDMLKVLYNADMSRFRADKMRILYSQLVFLINELDLKKYMRDVDKHQMMVG